MEINNLSKLGFGAYRVSIKSKAHFEALKMALDLGVNLIDTSANYTDGDSERLIGQVLEEFPQHQPFIITKAGYIQGKNLRLLELLNQEGKAKNDLVDLSPHLKHSIHPDFLESQLTASLERLKRDSVDALLLHNPEYYFDQKDVEIDPAIYYARIKKAFEWMEEKVKEGKIKYYGISSNTFPMEETNPRSTNILTITKLAGEVAMNNHFRFIQFPMNMIENGALTNQFNGKNLLEWAKSFKLQTLINRPLNAFTPDGLIRLATYELMDQPLNESEADEVFEICLKQLRKKWQTQDLEDKIENIPLIKQFTELWKFLPSPDAVEQVFQGHFFPFVAQVWGASGLSAEESKPFYLLYDVALLFSRRNMTLRALEYKKELQSKGIISNDDNRPFANLVIESYLKAGVDHVLVGMRTTEYVKSFRELI